jgi:hypothetical protein
LSTNKLTALLPRSTLLGHLSASAEAIDLEPIILPTKVA